MDGRALVEGAVTMFFIALFLSLGRMARKARPTGSPGGFELRYSGIVRGLGIVMCAVAVMLMILARVTTWDRSELTIGPWPLHAEHGGPYLAVAALPIALAGVVLVVESFTVFRIDPEGLLRQRIVGRVVYARWSDVSRVSARDEGAIRIVTPNVAMDLSTWLTGRDVLSARMLESVPRSAIQDRVATALQKLADPPTDRD